MLRPLGNFEEFSDEKEHLMCSIILKLINKFREIGSVMCWSTPLREYAGQPLENIGCKRLHQLSIVTNNFKLHKALLSEFEQKTSTSTSTSSKDLIVNFSKRSHLLRWSAFSFTWLWEYMKRLEIRKSSFSPWDINAFTTINCLVRILVRLRH